LQTVGGVCEFALLRFAQGGDVFQAWPCRQRPQFLMLPQRFYRLPVVLVAAGQLLDDFCGRRTSMLIQLQLQHRQTATE
jgi:hypothetical protein